ncbi:MAG: cytochrome c peroxidase [Bacteroidota bacterium]
MKYLLSLLGSILLGFTMVQLLPYDVPSHFPKPLYEFAEGSLEETKVQLGRALFYDPLLSKDGTISCASCHSSYNGFAHTDHDLSHGIHDIIGRRNAPALFNLAWQGSFMWDGAVNHLDMQALAPLHDSTEMASDINLVIERLKVHPTYPSFFQKAFGDGEITGMKVLKAFSQFQLSLTSWNAKYDKVKAGEDTFSPQEEAGYQLFQRHCNSCHTEPLFSSYEFANNGLPIDKDLQDMGRYGITGNPVDSLVFKIPSLRNLSYTYPYMHDGRFEKLWEVMNHYAKGVLPSSTLSPELKGGIPLSSREKVDLIAFLKTLDDKEFVFDKRHQFPRDFFFSQNQNNQK